MTNTLFIRSSPETTNIQYYVPTTGVSIQITRAKEAIVLLNPAGTLATLTLVLPTSGVENGDTVLISTSQILTALTITGTIVGTLTALALGGFAKFQYSASGLKWFRVG